MLLKVADDHPVPAVLDTVEAMCCRRCKSSTGVHDTCGANICIAWEAITIAAMVDVVILPGLDGTGTLLESFCAELGARGIRAHAIVYPTDRPDGYDGLE